MHQSSIHEWFEEVWNQGREEAVHRLLVPDAVIHNLAQDGKDSRGPEEFLTFFRTFRDAFPDIHIDVHETVTEGDLAACRFAVTGTHTGQGLGFAPTQRAVSFGGMSVVRMGGGRILEAWNVWDASGLREQLGFTMTPPQVS